MRATLTALIFCLAIAPLAGFAQTTTTGEANAVPGAAGVMLTTSISINLPLTAPDRAGKQVEEDGYRRDLYQRSVKECAVLLESIAADCVITSVNVSTQINSSPGQPDYLYASSTITMDVDLK